MTELIKVMIGLMCFVCFFGIIFASGKRFACLVGWVAFMALGSWLYGGLGAPNPPAAHQTPVISD